MARDAGIVLEALSQADAKQITRLFKERGLDTEREETLVWCFVSGTNPRRRRKNLKNLRRLVMGTLRDAGLERAPTRPPEVRVWDEARNVYVDARPDGGPLEDEDWFVSELGPADITYVVDVVPSSAFGQRRVRRALRKLRRPILRGGLRQIVVGARDAADADWIAGRAATSPDVRSATPRHLNRWHRWLLRQRLLGNYSAEPGDYIYYSGEVGGSGGEGGGGGGNGGGT